MLQIGTNRHVTHFIFIITSVPCMQSKKLVTISNKFSKSTEIFVVDALVVRVYLLCFSFLLTNTKTPVKRQIPLRFLNMQFKWCSQYIAKLCLETLRSHIDEIYDNVGWQYVLPLPGTKLDCKLLDPLSLHPRALPIRLINR